MAGNRIHVSVLVLLTCYACQVCCMDYPNLLQQFKRVASAHLPSETNPLRAFLGKSIRARTPSCLLRETYSKRRDYNLTEACRGSVDGFLNAFDDDVERTWALEMLDATTKVESGILQGNMLWLGAFDQCQGIRATNKSHGYLFSGMPCSVIVNNATDVEVKKAADGMAESFPGLVLGVCIPDKCTVADSMHLVNEVLYALPEDYQAISSTCHKDEPYPLDTPAIGVIVMLSIIGVVLVIATLYDLLLIQSGHIGFATKPYRINEGCETGEADDVQLLDSENEIKDKEHHEKEIKAIGDGERGILSMLMLRLSVYSNGAKLLATERSAGSLDALHGIRFLSLSWVILGHTYVFSLAFIQNIVVLPEVVKGMAFQAIMGASVSVDTFFLLSGTLVAYPLLNALKSKGGPFKINWLMFYFHRFWRLTPPYMIILGAHTALFKYMATGPFWKSEGIEKDCPTQWWANFIYLNNIIPSARGCMAWTWYLANDMQFYIASPLFVIALYKKPKVGLILCLVSIINSITVTATLTSINNYIADLQDIFTLQFVGTDMSRVVGTISVNAVLVGSVMATSVLTFVNDYPSDFVDTMTGHPTGSWFTQVYIAPWCRVAPYMVGLLLGYLLYKTERKVQLKWYVVLLGWVLAIFTAVSVVYGLYGVANGHPLAPGVNALYAGMHRVSWAVAVAWVIFACLTGYGGPVNTLLSWSPFIPLSRLTYMAYLIHPIVIYWFYLSRKTPLFFDQSTMVYYFLGHLCVSYACAFVASLSFESPMLGLEKVAFSRKKPQSQSQ